MNLSTQPQTDFYQKKLLIATLWLTSGLSLVIAVLNILTFDAPLVASFNALTLMSALLTLAYLARGGDMRVAAWAGTIIILLNLAAFLWVAKGGAYSFIWITVVPPFTYFLLGRKYGTLVSVIAFSYVVFIILTRTEWGDPAPFTTGAFFNIIEVMVAQLLLFLYYERSRRDAYLALARISETDKLTGLYNRQKLDDVLANCITQAQRNQQPLTVVLADVDLFKAINDEFGHLFGDRMLQHIASILATHTRSEDCLGRWGGEEFLLVLPNTDETQALAITERIRTHVEQSNALGHSLTMSFGVAQLQLEDTLTELVSKADDCLYTAKRTGRNKCIASLAV